MQDIQYQWFKCSLLSTFQKKNDLQKKPGQPKYSPDVIPSTSSSVHIQ